MRIVAGLLLSGMFAAIIISCSSPSSSAPVPSPSTAAVPSVPVLPPSSAQPVSSAEWLVDGVISTGEYLEAKKYGDFEMSWKTDQQHIYIGMKVKASGWVSFGIQPGRMMNNADIIFGFVTMERQQ